VRLWREERALQVEIYKLRRRKGGSTGNFQALAERERVDPIRRKILAAKSKKFAVKTSGGKPDGSELEDPEKLERVSIKKRD